jgi:hypothetical protein
MHKEPDELKSIPLPLTVVKNWALCRGNTGNPDPRKGLPMQDHQPRPDQHTGKPLGSTYADGGRTASFDYQPVTDGYIRRIQRLATGQTAEGKGLKVTDHNLTVTNLPRSMGSAVVNYKKSAGIVAVDPYGKQVNLRITNMNEVSSLFSGWGGHYENVAQRIKNGVITTSESKYKPFNDETHRSIKLSQPTKNDNELVITWTRPGKPGERQTPERLASYGKSVAITHTTQNHTQEFLLVPKPASQIADQIKRWQAANPLGQIDVNTFRQTGQLKLLFPYNCKDAC